MAPVLPFAVLGVLCSITPTFGIKTKLPDASGTPEVVGSVQDAQASSPSSAFYEANCGQLYLLSGLPEGASLKLTVNGWDDESRDFEAVLVTDHSHQLAKLRSGNQRTEDGSNKLPERPSESIVGVRIASKGDQENKSAVLTFGAGDVAPKEFPFESPAGPTTPFMIIVTQTSPSSMNVKVYTWISGEDSRVESGTWHEASKTVEVVHRPHTDLRFNVDVNSCGARVLKLYASLRTRAVTVQDGMCSSTEQHLVELSSRKYPEVSR